MHNPKLADKQGLDQTTRDVIDKLQLLRGFLEDSVVPEHPAAHKVDTYNIWLENERLLQKLWKFEQNDKFIKFWNFPACECPSMDNNERYPTGHYIMSESCPIHGRQGGLVEWK